MEKEEDEIEYPLRYAPMTYPNPDNWEHIKNTISKVMGIPQVPAELPFLHRLDIERVKGMNYFELKKEKAYLTKYAEGLLAIITSDEADLSEFIEKFDEEHFNKAPVRFQFQVDRDILAFDQKRYDDTRRKLRLVEDEMEERRKKLNKKE